MSDLRMETEALFASHETFEISLVDLVLAGCELSEDTGEICDWVDDVLAGETVTVRPGVAESAPLVPIDDLNADPYVTYIRLA